MVNLEKSCIFFTDNTPNRIWEDCYNALGVGLADSPGKYLGLPFLWGRSKCKALTFVRDKVKNKIQGWKHTLLSNAGREVLIKAVASAIPTYSMSYFKFLKKACGELDSLILKFWWGQRSGESSIH